MGKTTKFQAGRSGNPETQFKAGNPHRWQPGQSGNPTGIARSRVQFEEAFYAALLELGTADDMQPLLITPDTLPRNSISSNGRWNALPFQLELVKAEKARRSFLEFVRQAWHVLEPNTEFVEGIPTDAICIHLQAVTEGKIANLIINVPPRSCQVTAGMRVLGRLGLD